MTNKIRVRFPPSPTGNLHIGNARTALFNYLFARHHQGTFVFRIEDTDAERSKESYIENEIDALSWLKIDWDEGIKVGGTRGPYKQSERLFLYREVVEKLLSLDRAYYCFCTREELENERKGDNPEEQSFKYSGRCRSLSAENIRKNLDAKIPHTVRFKLPIDSYVQVNDLVRGHVQFPLESLDDFILVRSDGTPTYNLAVMADDALMEITHVIRGEDHFFGNTPRQILLYHALSFPLPAFAHMPMILGSDRTKLSKRHGAFAVTDYREMGFLPEALVNYMALLGWSPGNDLEIMTMEEMINLFDISKVQSSPAGFDFEKLKWFNGQYLRNKSSTEIVEELCRIDPSYTSQLCQYQNALMDLTSIIEGLKPYAVTLKDLPELIKCIESYQEVQKENIHHICQQETLELLRSLAEHFNKMEEWSLELIKETVRSTGKALKMKGKALFHPIRYVLSNMNEGPDLNVLMYIKGRNKTIEALQRATALLEKEEGNGIQNQAN